MRIDNGYKEYKTLQEVKQREEEAIGHSFKEIFELAWEFQQKNGLKEKHGKGGYWANSVFGLIRNI